MTTTTRVSVVVAASVIKCVRRCITFLNPLMSILKPQSNEPLYNNTAIGTLAIDQSLCAQICNKMTIVVSIDG